MAGISFTTGLWANGENSYATTVPGQILAIKGVNVDQDVEAEWSINQETGAVEVELKENDNE